MRGCAVCGIVPRQFWLFGGTKFWYSLDIAPDQLCSGCYFWARRCLGLSLV
jgi:hypothetical protein